MPSLSTLLQGLETVGAPGPALQAQVPHNYQDQLAQKRLGVASSLFAALRAKHPPSAAHCLRVALGVSSWTFALDFTDAQRDLVEIGALLHDIGKIGVPEHVLLKPGRLAGEEVLLMEQHCRIARDILAGCCGTPELLDIVYYAAAWYDGGKHGFNRRGAALPLGSRMIAIMDAFDAMTTEQIYRRAMSHERALAELYQHAGSQFDAELVRGFSELLSRNQPHCENLVTRRWLHQLDARNSQKHWSHCPEAGDPAGGVVQDAFHSKLLDAMRDGVIFVDRQLVVLLWNRAAERLSGIGADSVMRRQWSPSLIGLCDEHGRQVDDAECPILGALRSGTQTLQRFTIAGRGGRRCAIDVHVAPVISPLGTAVGAAVTLHDASSQISLEERVQTLHERATRDPLTKVANRAEFERVFPESVAAHLELGSPCSLIICDVDHFKRVNDTYGHQAGDDALVAFAAHLQRYARSSDLVARYGGEEFIVLCTDCDNAAATSRAEEIRRVLAGTPQPALDRQPMTASFGVTEVQAGDTPETFLHRADRALLQAKDSGRNRVVQLGMGIVAQPPEPVSRGWLSWFRETPREVLAERTLMTVVPLAVAAEKLRGFVADQRGEILSLHENRVVIQIDGRHTPLLRRSNDRPVALLMEITFGEQKAHLESGAGREVLRTIVRVAIRPKRQRDRRQRDAIQRAKQLLVSLKSYLMAHDFEGPIVADASGTPAPNSPRN